MTVTILPSRTLVAVVVEGKTHALPEGTTDVDVFGVVKPFVPFTEYALDYVGPKEQSTVIVERILPGEGLFGADARLAAKVKAFADGV